MSRRRFFWAAGLVLMVMTTGFPAWAGEPTEQIRQTTDKILVILTNPELKAPERLKERTHLVRKAVDERFDWEEMSQRTLARHWAKRTDAEKKEFTDLFGRLLQQTYMEKVGNYSGEKVLYEGDTLEGDYGTVKVKILTTKETEIPVLYKVRKKGTDWFVYDVVVEGISLIQNYRSQFNSILSNSTFGELLNRLKTKTEGT